MFGPFVNASRGQGVYRCPKQAEIGVALPQGTELPQRIGREHQSMKTLQPCRADLRGSNPAP